MVNATPGRTAPVASFTVPTISLVALWACAAGALKNDTPRNSESDNTPSRTGFLLSCDRPLRFMKDAFSANEWFPIDRIRHGLPEDRDAASNRYYTRRWARLARR